MRAEARPEGRRGGRRPDKTIFGVPERFEKPRLTLYVVPFALFAFGLLMIYSSSSIVALTSEATGHNPTYYLMRQAGFGAVGILFALIIARVDYHIWSHRLLVLLWIVTTAMLALVIFTASGSDAYGATRWFQLGPFRLQPSEFAKVTIVLTAANLCQRYFDEGSLEWREFLLLGIVGVGLPVLLILVQPDKGSTMICGATVLVMLYLSGVPGRFVIALFILAFALMLAWSIRDDYSRARILTVFNPWADRYGDGYQLIQGFYAFGSGGLFGVGIGASRQKYSYLPMAYNDFIFAVIGEECGLIGTLGVLAAFTLLVWAGFRIARYAPDLSGRLIAAGSVSMLAIQLLVNICGVLGVMPLSGKPVPFLSYGGSSIISCLMLVGMVASVSRASYLEETESDARRRDISLTGSLRRDGSDDGSGFVGEPRPRSARPGAAVSAPRLTLVDGGETKGRSVPRPVPRPTPLARQDRAPRGRITTDASGHRRIDLGPDAADRLRGARSSSGGRDGRNGR